MKTKVVVIDDDPSLVHLMRMNLEEQGYDVYTGYDGQSAIQLTTTERPSLVILDLNMPMTNGLKAMESIQANSETEKTPIILLTGETSERIPPQALASGRICHLKKPIDLEDLNGLVKTLIEKFPTR